MPMNARRGNLLLAAAVCWLSSGCHTIPLYGSPVASARPAPLEMFSVDWWKQLVAPEPFEYEPRELATPALDPEGHRLIVLTRDGVIRAFNQEGKEDWSYQTHGRFNAGATVLDGVAYVAGGDGSLYALDARSGKLSWRYDAKEELGTTPVLSQGKVLVASLTDTIYAVDQKTGKWLWQYRRDTPSGFTIRGASRPSVRAELAYVGFADGHLVALRIEDGSVKWEKALSTEGQYTDVDSAPVLDEAGRIYAASYKDGIFALDASTGDMLWHTVKSGITSLLASGGTLYAAGDGQLEALSTLTGKVIWSAGFKGRAARLPVLVRNTLVVPTNDALVFVDPLNGREMVAWNPGKGVSAPPLWIGAHLYVVSNGGYLYSLRLPGRGG